MTTSKPKAKEKRLNPLTVLVIAFWVFVGWAFLRPSEPEAKAPTKLETVKHSEPDLKALEKQYGKYYGSYGDFKLFDVGITDDADAVKGTALNMTDKSFKYVSVALKLKEKGGAVTDSPYTNVNNIGPHEAWNFKVSAPDNGWNTYEISGVTAY